MTHDERLTRALEAIAVGIARGLEYARHDHNAHYAVDLPDPFDRERFITEAVEAILLERGAEGAAAKARVRAEKCGNCGHERAEHQTTPPCTHEGCQCPGFEPAAAPIACLDCGHAEAEHPLAGGRCSVEGCACAALVVAVEGARICGQSLAAIGIVTPCPLPAGHVGPCRRPRP